MEMENNNNKYKKRLQLLDGEAVLPPGFRFHPTDEELISYYLVKKVVDCSFTSRAIAEVDLNKCEPWHLPGKAKMGEKEWYFFSLRDRKYPTGLRTNRATEAGYWKATGKDREIYSSKTTTLVGMKKTLVFYKGRAPKGEKSNWVMHEYRLEGNFAYHYFSKSSKDEWVISRVFQKSGPGSGSTSSSASKKRPSTSTSAEELVVVTSPSCSVAHLLPPLFEASTDRESCSNAPNNDHHEHVSCFSTTPTSFNSLFELPPPPPLIMHDPSFSANRFPSLRSLQDNLHLPPFFFSAHVPPPPSSDQVSGFGGHWPAPENHKMTELDCMWGY